MTKAKEYAISKETCESWIKGVCDGCGAQLEAVETVDNAGVPTHWVGCMACKKFGNGVNPRHFAIGRALVLEHTLRPYSFIQEGEYQWLERQTAAASRIVARIHAMLNHGQVQSEQLTKNAEAPQLDEATT